MLEIIRIIIFEIIRIIMLEIIRFIPVSEYVNQTQSFFW